MEVTFGGAEEKPRPRKQLRISSESEPATPASPPDTPVGALPAAAAATKSVTFAQQQQQVAEKSAAAAPRRFHHSESDACIGRRRREGAIEEEAADSEYSLPAAGERDERESYSDDEPIGVEAGSAGSRRRANVLGAQRDDDLPPEVEEGNVEYKLKLIGPTASRLAHLTTQLKWRLREGCGEAFYELGVQDNGACVGLSAGDMEQSVATLRAMAAGLGATLMVVGERRVPDHSGGAGGEPLRVAEVLVRRVPDNQQFLDLRVAVLGCADAGKSTLLGVLTQGELDNGRGRARLNLFRHLHEVHTGRTSSISLECLGFDAAGQPVNYARHSMEEMCEKSTKLVTFIDLAGHQKYLRTTIFGLTGYKPHCALLCVAANMGLAGTSREHLGLALALDVPVIVAVTKVDSVAKPHLDKVLHSVERLLQGPGCKKTAVRVADDEAAVAAASQFDKAPIVPVFMLSAVSGAGLRTLQKFLNLLPVSLQAGGGNAAGNRAQVERRPELFHVDEMFNVPNVRGRIAAGVLETGVVREGDSLLAGPDRHGGFHPVRIASLHRNKQAVRCVRAGQSACLQVVPAAGGDDYDGASGSTFVADAERAAEVGWLRRGMVLSHASLRPVASLAFEAKVFVLYHPAARLCVGFQATVHVGNVCQTARLCDMDKRSLSTGDTARVTFVFVSRPEFLAPGSRLLFRAGKTKAIGQVTRVALDPSECDKSGVARTKTF